MKIFILQAGWVIIGQQDGDKITNAYVIRRWGTSQGLGQLALHGIQPETVLDPLPNLQLQTGPIAVLDCSEQWSPEYIAATLVSRKL